MPLISELTLKLDGQKLQLLMEAINWAPGHLRMPLTGWINQQTLEQQAAADAAEKAAKKISKSPPKAPLA